jgi:hypothetical protein
LYKILKRQDGSLKKRTTLPNEDEDGKIKDDENNDLYPLNTVNLNTTLDKYIKTKVF